MLPKICDAQTYHPKFHKCGCLIMYYPPHSECFQQLKDLATDQKVTLAIEKKSKNITRQYVEKWTIRQDGKEVLIISEL